MEEKIEIKNLSYFFNNGSLYVKEKFKIYKKQTDDIYMCSISKNLIDS